MKKDTSVRITISLKPGLQEQVASRAEMEDKAVSSFITECCATRCMQTPEMDASINALADDSELTRDEYLMLLLSYAAEKKITFRTTSKTVSIFSSDKPDKEETMVISIG